ncbi:cupin domain-containing protein [Neptuniibacter sp.]|uniref:cupin domain-containing protein n=1 Tax=Neptuniibacter sp. TaxID=1962643 RepID=UPI002635509D|nr:cupin domain-containing protein [Neptuniibacter sp.]MCP4595180.1 cupin domain-containing protein [Neptuniibacter sp.]
MSNSPFGDISVKQFLEEYWQKKPLLVRNAFPDFEPPVSPDELAGLALEEDVESRLIIQSPDGKDWQLKHGPLSEESFSELPDSHWTLLVQAVDHWVPEASELVEQFRFAPNWRLDDLMISYATDGGGVGPHYDNYDVFLIQASGTRRWEFGGIYGEDSPRRDDVPVMILPEWEAEQSFDLQPGDMLYLPPRVGHNGYAVGDDCMTYSVGFRAPSHQEIWESFSNYLDNITCAEDRYSDPDLQQQANPGEITASAIQRVQNILHEYIDSPELLSHWFGQFMTDPKYPDLAGEQSSELSDDEIRSLIEQGAPLCRTEGSRFAFYRQDGHFILFADGKGCACSPEQTELAEQLCADLYHSDIKVTEDNIVLIKALLLQGSVYFLDADL